MAKKIIPLLLLIFNFLVSNAQENNIVSNIESPINGKTVSFTEFIQAMKDGDKLVPKDGRTYEFVIRDVKVRFVKEIDKGKGGMDDRFLGKGGDTIEIESNLRIVDIDFDPEFWFVPRLLKFKGHIWITNTTKLHALFKQCVFEKSIALLGNEIQFIDFDECRFENGFRCVRGVTIDHLKFDNCIFDIKKDLVDNIIKSNLGVETRTFILDNKIQNIDLTIQNSKFLVKKELRDSIQFFISLKGSIFSNLRLVNNEIETSLDLENSSISNNFQLSKTNIEGHIFLFGININPLGTRLEWELVTKKLAIYDYKRKKIYSYKVLDEIPLDIYNDLFSTYSIIYTAFKSQGNRYSTNQCYIEWKNLETEYLYKLSLGSDDLTAYFTYMMNLFLEIFCDYGTNPLKSLYMSFYVLMFFAGVYFFLPHRFGYQQNDFYGILSIYVDFVKYPESLLRNIQSEKELLLENHKSFLTFRNKIKESKAPFYFYLISLPDYLLYLWKISNHQFSYRYLKMMIGLRKAEKPAYLFLSKFLLVISVVWLVLENILKHSLDCIALSINIFTTLGFGNTEIKGLPMYLTVVEGFIGWFLLSFFSLSLISQLIN